MSLTTIISLLFLVSALCDSSTAALNKRIVNGVIADVTKYLYMASLRDATNVHFCGGTVVNNNFILTTAYCVSGRTSFNIVVGTKKLNTGGVTYASSTITIHPLYNSITDIYDVAVVRTATSIVYSATVQPVVLANVNLIVGAVPVEIGWGKLNQASALSNDLLALNTTVISKSSCQTQINPLGFTLQTTHMCTFQPNSGACIADDGGPLVIFGMQVGIISVYGCELNYPNVYTNVPSVYFWIQPIINPSG